MTDTTIYSTEIVNKEYKGLRIDKFLTQSFPDLSRSQIQRLISEGCLRADEETILDNSFKVRIGDSYQLEIPPAQEALPVPEDIPLDVVYEDSSLIVVNKPAGMTVHPAPGAYSGTLVNALLFHCRDNLSGIGGVKRPGIVHRIDKDTSGLLVVAKNDKAHRCLCEQFFVHSIERTYYALAYGVPQPLQGRVEANIGRSPYDRKKMAVVNQGGKTAVTNYAVQEIYKNMASLVKCNLETGRTHQIRVHMAHLGCNLIGDQLYVKSKKMQYSGVDTETKKYIAQFPRQALHAQSLGFIHPETGEFMSFYAEFPKDFTELKSKLQSL